MKNLKTILIAFTFAAGLAAPALRAEPEGPGGPPPGEHPGKGEKGPRGGGMQRLSEELALTDAQKTQIEPLFKEQMATLKALRDDTSLTDEARKAKAKEIRDANTAKIRALLTAEQQVKFDAMKPMRGPGGPKEKKS